MGDTCQECGESMEPDDDWVSVCTDFVNGWGETLPICVGWYHAECLWPSGEGE
jgi:hypothetical protein